MDIFIAIGALLAGLLAGALAVRHFAKGEAGVPRHRHEQAQQDIARLEGQCAALETQLKELKAALEHAQGELRKQAGMNAALEAEKRVVGEQLGNLQAQFKTQFENLANGILEKNTEKFNIQSQQRLQELLNPLKERFGEFQKKVDESFGTQSKEQFSLKEEIRRIVETNEKMRLQTESLTQALKGDTKVQGDWGEVILERILEDAGLQKGRDYVVQGTEMGLRHIEHDGVLKPDVIVKLPEQKHLIIDSKVSLTHYERFCTAQDEAERGTNLKQYLQSIRTHAKGLEERRYQDTDGLGTPDFVLMFMPIEGAYALAIQQDSELHAYAWNRRVVIVCPSTLFATMQTVNSLWKIEARNRNAEEIARRGGALYDKIAGFIEDMENLDKHLGRARGSFDEAFRKLHTGQGNMLRQAEKLKDLGASASRQLPSKLLDEPEETTPLLAEVS